VGSIPIARSNSLTQLKQESGRFPFAGRKETAMSDPGGWLWVVLGVVGVGGLAVAIAYSSILWSRRRKNRATRQKRDEATREIYRHGQ
jgi:hypothetical protein